MVKEEVQFVTRRLALIDSSLRELMSKRDKWQEFVQT